MTRTAGKLVSNSIQRASLSKVALSEGSALQTSRQEK
jgi:hypothetical protein